MIWITFFLVLSAKGRSGSERGNCVESIPVMLSSSASDKCGISWKIDDIVHERRLTEFFEKFSICRPDTKRDDGPCIPENRIRTLHRFWVTYRFASTRLRWYFRASERILAKDPVANSGTHRRTDRNCAFFLGHIHPPMVPTESSRSSSPEQGLLSLADATLGKRFRIFRLSIALAHVERRDCLTDNVRIRALGKKLSDLVLNRRDDLQDT